MCILLFSFGCTGYSLVEQNIISGLPEKYRSYTSGFILSPSKSDIEDAISLGRNSANDNSLMYAYIFKGPSDFWNNSDVYIKIATPLYLISNHAREQARDYKDIDPIFIEYCKELDAVRISLIRQYVRDLRVFPFKRQFVLLRNGKRIEPLSSIKAYKDRNPFATTDFDKNIQDVLSMSQRLMQSQPLMTMTPERLQDLTETYKSLGYSDAQIRVFMDAIKAGTRTKEPTTNTKEPVKNVVLFESDAVYKASELRKPGKYEIVFRTPASNILISSGDKEIRFPISFDKFK